VNQRDTDRKRERESEREDATATIAGGSDCGRGNITLAKITTN